MNHAMAIEKRKHAFDVRGLKMCSPELHKEYNKLKRENAMMRRWLKMFLEMCDGEKAWEEVMREVNAKMPGLAGGKG